MLKKINPSQADVIRKSKLADHPLLLTCQQVFKHYMATMERFDFCSEDLFVAVAQVIDRIFENPKEAPTYITGLWDQLKIDMKVNAQTFPPQNDLDTVCNILFYIVAGTLSLHWHSYYKQELVDQLLHIIDKKKVISDEDEKNDVIANLCCQSVGLDDWINNYDESDCWLSDEIDEVLQKKTTTPEIRPKKKVRNAKNWFTEDTFTYKGYDSDDYKTLRLNLIVSGLLDGFVKGDTPKQWVKNLFSGIPMPKSDKIVWTGTVSELTYFFRTLNGKKLLTYSDNGFFWDIVASHFQVETHFKKSVKKTAINPESLSHHTEKPNDANTKKLDNMIVYFEPYLNKLLPERDDDQEEERHKDMARKDYKFNH